MSLSFIPSLSPEMDGQFQKSYYEQIRPSLRVMTLVLTGLFIACAFRDFANTRSPALAAGQDGAPIAYFAVLCMLTWLPAFGRVWQPAVTVGGWITVLISLKAMAIFMAKTAAMHIAPTSQNGPYTADSLFFGQQVCLLMVCLAALRLPFKWNMALEFGVLGVGLWVFLARLLSTPTTVDVLLRFLQPIIVIFAAVLLASFVQEQLTEKAFVANQLLEEERNDERGKREQTERMLHVLSQAIGGIVHDLGNPLTVVQGGAQTLDMILDGGGGDSEEDKAVLREMTEAIGSGTRILNHLRLSLIEQTRVLEGKPTPVDMHPVSLRSMVEEGGRFQHERIRENRSVRIKGKDVWVCADEMKMVTVFMNLIGNALKYSDGEVAILWQAPAVCETSRSPMLQVAVCDQGRDGQGLTEAQAAQLFTAFGRLESHASIEGLGLGLLSVQKIAEAQGGTVSIQGYADGTPSSPRFSTSPKPAPSMLSGAFRTAFVLECPLWSPSQIPLILAAA